MSETPEDSGGVETLPHLPFNLDSIDLSALDPDLVERVKHFIETAGEVIPDGITWADAVEWIKDEFEDEGPLLDPNPDGTPNDAPVPRTAADWMPGATRRLISGKVRSRGSSKPDALIFHIAAGESSSLYSWFSSPVRGCSHFYVLKSGKIEQYIPISSKSGSEFYGNHHTISVETQGGSSSTAKQQWTDAQVKALAKIAAWLNEAWGVPLKAMNNSNASEKGVGWHRLGIDGNFPTTGLYRGRGQRGTGQLWTTARGKTCPENYANPAASISRIAQINGIINTAKDLEGGATGTFDKGRISEDGYWGKSTTSLAQEIVTGVVDGIVSEQPSRWKSKNPGLTSGWQWKSSPKKGGSRLIRGLQTFMNKQFGESLTVDGWIGTETIKALQRTLTKMGYYDRAIDGEMWKGSATIKAFQAALNKGEFGS